MASSSAIIDVSNKFPAEGKKVTLCYYSNAPVDKAPVFYARYPTIIDVIAIGSTAANDGTLSFENGATP